jgi:hypothetical protein
MSKRGERASSSTKEERESRTPELHWISLKQQLPARDFIILIYDTELMVGVAVAVFDGKNFFSVAGDKLTTYKNVTHWMRLPNPPLMM